MVIIFTSLPGTFFEVPSPFTGRGFRGGVNAQTAEAGYYILTEVDNPTPYVGEAVIYKMRLYTAVNFVGNPRYLPPSYDGFWQDTPSDDIPSSETINGQQYSVFTINTRLFPLRSGELTIPAGEMRLRPSSIGTSVLLTSDPVPLRVQPLPPNPPDDFSGAVGSYQMAAQVDRAAVSVGEPITLTLTIIGLGNLEQATIPALALPSGWRAYDRPAEFRPWLGARPDQKIFTWLLVPGQAGQVTLDTLTWSYFDPADGMYHTLAADPIPLDVQPGAAPNPPALAADSPAQPVAQGQGFRAIKPVPANFGAPLVRLDVGFWLMWLLPPIVMLLIGVALFAQRRARHGYNPNQTMYKQAKRQLGRTRHGTDYAAVERVILNYFAERLDLSPDAVQLENLRAVMGKYGVSDHMQTQVMDCLDAAQAKRFAPSADMSMEQLMSRARSLLRTLTKEWEPER
jgi:hypothetical protein